MTEIDINSVGSFQKGGCSRWQENDIGKPQVFQGVVEAMNAVRLISAFLGSVIITYGFASTFYTFRVLSEQRAVGITYTASQQAETYLANFLGLPAYGAVIAIALAIAFIVASFAKKVLKPLAPIAYPLAGGTAIFVALLLIESQLGGGAGVIGGAREPLGMALQSVAGATGGLLFDFLRPKAR